MIHHDAYGRRPSHVKFGSDHRVDLTISPQKNEDMESKIDESNGITSDRAAIVKEPINMIGESPTIMTRATDMFKHAFDWMMG